jgi:hypothetical protein
MMWTRLDMSPLALAVATAAELPRQMLAAGAHEAADRIGADLAAARRAIVLKLDAELALACVLQPRN